MFSYLYNSCLGSTIVASDHSFESDCEITCSSRRSTIFDTKHFVRRIFFIHAKYFQNELRRTLQENTQPNRTRAHTHTLKAIVSTYATEQKEFQMQAKLALAVICGYPEKLCSGNSFRCSAALRGVTCLVARAGHRWDEKLAKKAFTFTRGKNSNERPSKRQ